MKIVADTTCPGCKKTHEVEIDIDKLDVKAPPASTSNPSSSQTTILEQKPLEKPEPEIKIETVIEDFKPNYECPDGDCEIGVHKNKNYKRKPKGKCANCDQFTKNKSGTCPWCKGTEIDEVDPEELDNLGILNPPEVEHTHE